MKSLLMEREKEVAYYCFNKNCSVSVYGQSAVMVLVLPLTVETLGQKPVCLLCKSKLVSLIDLEIKKSLIIIKKHWLNDAI
jgi:hypothetical protein